MGFTDTVGKAFMILAFARSFVSKETQMSLTKDSEFKSQPRIDKRTFLAVLSEADSFGSPLWNGVADPESAASAIYDLIVVGGHDPAVWLAICGREHSFGTNPNSVLHRNDTRSWTNARTIRLPGLPGTQVHDPVRDSKYVKYNTVVDSVRDGVFRIDDPEFEYQHRGAKTIGEVISIWTESESNAYTNFIVTRVSEWSARSSDGEQDGTRDDHGVPIRVDIIPQGNPNRPGLEMQPRFITVHETANPRRGANADMHRRFVNDGGGSGKVSWHFTVDNQQIVQHLPLTENGWHAGDGFNGVGNRQSIGIELCVNEDGNFDRTIDNAAWLIRRLMADHGIPAERVVQHNHWSGKDCPTNLRRGGRWDRLKARLTEPQRGLAGNGTSRQGGARLFPETGHTIMMGFQAFWEANGGIRVFGFPMTDEFTALDSGKTTQVFERYMLEWDPDAPPEWQVRGRFVVPPPDYRDIVPESVLAASALGRKLEPAIPG